MRSKNINADIELQISWVYTEDLDSTTHFYSRILGLECIRDEGGARIFATGTSSAIGLCQVFGDRVVEPRGGMLSIVCNDVDVWYRRLLQRGAVIPSAPERLQQFGIYRFVVEDPNGYIIEFEQFDS